MTATFSNSVVFETVGAVFVNAAMSETKKVNIDLQKERDKCTFNITELTHLIDGSAQLTKERRIRGTILYGGYFRLKLG